MVRQWYVTEERLREYFSKPEAALDETSAESRASAKRLDNKDHLGGGGHQSLEIDT
jgi:hypothetical protein